MCLPVRLILVFFACYFSSEEMNALREASALYLVLAFVTFPHLNKYANERIELNKKYMYFLIQREQWEKNAFKKTNKYSKRCCVMYSNRIGFGNRSLLSVYIRIDSSRFELLVNSIN